MVCFSLSRLYELDLTMDHGGISGQPRRIIIRMALQLTEIHILFRYNTDPIIMRIL